MTKTDSGEADEVSEIAVAFVELKKKLFAAGRLNLTAPMDASEFEALTDIRTKENAAADRKNDG